MQEIAASSHQATECPFVLPTVRPIIGGLRDSDALVLANSHLSKH